MTSCNKVGCLTDCVPEDIVTSEKRGMKCDDWPAENRALAKEYWDDIEGKYSPIPTEDMTEDAEREEHESSLMEQKGKYFRELLCEKCSLFHQELNDVIGERHVSQGDLSCLQSRYDELNRQCAFFLGKFPIFTNELTERLRVIRSALGQIERVVSSSVRLEHTSCFESLERALSSGSSWGSSGGTSSGGAPGTSSSSECGSSRQHDMQSCSSDDTGTGSGTSLSRAIRRWLQAIQDRTLAIKISIAHMSQQMQGPPGSTDGRAELQSLLAEAEKLHQRIKTEGRFLFEKLKRENVEQALILNVRKKWHSLWLESYEQAVVLQNALDALNETLETECGTESESEEPSVKRVKIRDFDKPSLELLVLPPSPEGSELNIPDIYPFPEEEYEKIMIVPDVLETDNPQGSIDANGNPQFLSAASSPSDVTNDATDEGGLKTGAPDHNVLLDCGYGSEENSVVSPDMTSSASLTEDSLNANEEDLNGNYANETSPLHHPSDPFPSTLTSSDPSTGDALNLDKRRSIEESPKRLAKVTYVSDDEAPSEGHVASAVGRSIANSLSEDSLYVYKHFDEDQKNHEMTASLRVNVEESDFAENVAEVDKEIEAWCTEPPGMDFQDNFEHWVPVSSREYYNATPSGGNAEDGGAVTPGGFEGGSERSSDDEEQLPVTSTPMVCGPDSGAGGSRRRRRRSDNQTANHSNVLHNLLSPPRLFASERSLNVSDATVPTFCTTAPHFDHSLMTCSDIGPPPGVGHVSHWSESANQNALNPRRTRRHQLTAQRQRRVLPKSMSDGENLGQWLSTGQETPNKYRLAEFALSPIRVPHFSNDVSMEQDSLEEYNWDQFDINLVGTPNNELDDKVDGSRIEKYGEDYSKFLNLRKIRGRRNDSQSELERCENDLTHLLKRSQCEYFQVLAELQTKPEQALQACELNLENLRTGLGALTRMRPEVQGYHLVTDEYYSGITDLINQWEDLREKATRVILNKSGGGFVSRQRLSESISCVSSVLSECQRDERLRRSPSFSSSADLEDYILRLQCNIETLERERLVLECGAEYLSETESGTGADIKEEIETVSKNLPEALACFMSRERVLQTVLQKINEFRDIQKRVEKLEERQERPATSSLTQWPEDPIQPTNLTLMSDLANVESRLELLLEENGLALGYLAQVLSEVKEERSKFSDWLKGVIDSNGRLLRGGDLSEPISGPNCLMLTKSTNERRSLRGKLWRCVRYSWPVQLCLLLVVLLAAVFMQPLCCHQRNNWKYAWATHLDYVRGAPPT